MSEIDYETSDDCELGEAEVKTLLHAMDVGNAWAVDFADKASRLIIACGGDPGTNTQERDDAMDALSEFAAAGYPDSNEDTRGQAELRAEALQVQVEKLGDSINSLLAERGGTVEAFPNACPRPWGLTYLKADRLARIFDADGLYIGNCIAEADAALIVAAVNAYGGSEVQSLKARLARLGSPIVDERNSQEPAKPAAEAAAKLAAVEAQEPDVWLYRCGNGFEDYASLNPHGDVHGGTIEPRYPRPPAGEGTEGKG